MEKYDGKMMHGTIVIKKVTLLILVLGVFAGGYYYQTFHQQTVAQNTLNHPMPVQVYVVAPHTIFDEIEALGTAFANEAVNVTSKATDKIQEIRFQDGQTVRKGEIIVVLEQDEEKAQLRAEEAQVLEHERELKRLEDLLKRNAAAKNEYDARKTMLAISKHRIQEIVARIENKTIRAPFDGILGLRKISVGSLVVPGDLITTLDDISQIKLDFHVPSIFLDVVKEGLTIKAESEALGQRLVRGTVTKISPRVDARTRSVEVRAILPNPEGLIKPGILLRVRLLRNERQALMIPEEAVFMLQDKQYVYSVNENNIVQRHLITLGKRQPGWVEVISGLSAGQRVITRGISRVKDSDIVHPEISLQTYSKK